MTAQRDAELQRLRDRWNTVPIAIAGILWFFPLTMFWMRYVPAFRPFSFHAPVPPLHWLLAAVSACAIPFLLPKGYFRPKHFERGAFYPALGLRLFRWIAPDGDLINRRLRRLDPCYRAVRSRAALREHIAGTYSNERWHSSLFLVGLFTSIFAIRAGEILFAGILTLGNVVFNLYPALHQRYKRARVRPVHQPQHV